MERSSSSVTIISESELQGLIFDCDGTLINTMPAYWKSWVQTCRQYGINFSEERFYAMAGVPVRDIFKILIAESFEDGHPNKPDLDAVMETKQAFGKISIVDVGMPRIDVVVAIAESYHKKIPMAVASSGHREFVMESLEKNGILHYFDAVITGEDVTNPKPAPDIFLLAASRLGVDPLKCRGFEDGGVGLEALAAAGMEVVDVKLMEGYPGAKPSSVSVLHDSYS